MRFPNFTVAGICLASLAMAVTTGMKQSAADTDDGEMSEFDVSLVSGPNPEVEQIVAKEQIARSLARGEIGMPEAIRRVRELYPNEPAFLRYLRSRHPEASDDELYGQNLITTIRALEVYRRREMAA